MTATKPAILWVPGAWHVPRHYEPALKVLRQAGYETIVANHASVNVSKDSGNMLRKDATTVADMIRKLFSEDKNIVLVMHSYGGISGSEAAAMVSEHRRATSSDGGPRILRLVYLAAHVIEKGVSFKANRTIPDVTTSEKGMMVHNSPYERYYHDVSREQAQPAIDMLQAMASSTFETPTVYAGWRDYGIPCTYIKCLQDVALPSELCNMYIARLREGGVDAERSGGFEGSSGAPSPSPPSSPDRNRSTRKRSDGDAAYNITEECERLFCETLKAVFLVEKDTGLENSLVVDMRNKKSNSNAKSIASKQQQHTIMKHDLPTPSPSPDGRIYPNARGLVEDYVEVWDYVGGARFRGFVAEQNDERSLFVFFDRKVLAKDLKPGLMALLELASGDSLECDNIVVCVDRTAGEEADDVIRDIGWVGFHLITLDAWVGKKGCVSDRWLFLGMDV